MAELRDYILNCLRKNYPEDVFFSRGWERESVNGNTMFCTKYFRDRTKKKDGFLRFFSGSALVASVSELPSKAVIYVDESFIPRKDVEKAFELNYSSEDLN